MDILVTREEVLAWIAADSDKRGPAVAARHFGIKGTTVRTWLNRARATAGATVKRGGATGTLHVLPPAPPESKEHRPQTVIMSAPIEDKPLPDDLHDLAIEVLRDVLGQMKRAAGTAKGGELAQMLGSVADRLPTIGDARKKGDASQAANPATAEGRAALVDEVAALPPDLLAEAMQRQRTG